VLERWTAAVLRYRLVVLACWLAVLGVGLWSATRLPPLLTSSLSVPGTDSERARTILTNAFGERPDGTFTVVFRVRHPSDAALRARLHRRLAVAARAVPSGHATALRRGGGVLYGDVATTLDLQHAKKYTDDLRLALRAAGGLPAEVTGPPAIQSDLDPILSSDLRRGEAVAAPIALLVLLTVLGLSLAVTIPFLVAACSIAATLAVVYACAGAVPVVTYVPNLVELLGLGLAIDYSLLVVSRFREELARGRPLDDAIAATTATAGRAVVFSGVAVAIGLGLLLFMPIPFIRSMGLGGFVIPLASVAAALTLQPVLLSLLGRGGTRRLGVAAFLRRHGRLPLPVLPGTRDVDDGLWARLARSIMRRPVAYLAAGTTLLVAAAVPVFFLHLTPISVSGLPRSPESLQAYALLRERVGPGAVTPTEIVVDGGGAGLARRRPVRAAVDRLADSLFHDPEVLLVASGTKAPFVDGTGRYARVIVAGRHEYDADASRAFVDRLRERLIPAARFPEGRWVDAGGAPSQGVDFLARSYSAFPWLVLAVLALTFVALLRAFRSLVLPVKAVLLNLLTVAAVYGLLVVVFRWGVGTGLLGLHHAGHVEGWVPIFLFALLFGLSMDYEVFMVMRIREAWEQTGDNAEAVARGLERTGRVVTAAAAIMVAAFSGLVAGRVAGLEQLGVGLALAVVVDATVVRALLVPSLMAILDRYNWWLPARLAWLAGVSPSPLPARRHGGRGRGAESSPPSPSPGTTSRR
jgi:RND superfamily putative drug exporter